MVIASKFWISLWATCRPFAITTYLSGMCNGSDRGRASVSGAVECTGAAIERGANSAVAETVSSSVV